MTNAEKVREDRLRRAARRQGLWLSKSRTRDPRALGYNRWRLTDPNKTEQPIEHRLTIDEVERRLRGEQP